MKITKRVFDYTDSDSVQDSPELSAVLICIQRALLLAWVPGIRCTNELNGIQNFELADGTPASLYINELQDKARKGEPIPSPREVLTLFGLPCFSNLPCGAPVPLEGRTSNMLNTSINPEKK